MMSANIPNNRIPNPDKSAKKENLWVNLAFNIAIPAIILSKFSNDDYLGITFGLVVALAFPFLYGVMDFFQRDKINIFSVLGVISTLLTGSISLLKLGPEYIAIKEAAIPGLIGITIFISTWTRFPLVGKLIMNEAIFNLKKLNQAISDHQAEEQLNKVLRNCSFLVSLSFAFSSMMNYLLAVWVVVSDPGTVAYNEELGKMTALSYPVIALPSMIIMGAALFYLVRHIQKITGKGIEEFLLIEQK